MALEQGLRVPGQFENPQTLFYAGLLGFLMALDVPLQAALFLAPLARYARPAARRARRLSRAGWKDAIQARIGGLTELRDKMEGCIGCGCLSKEDCPLRNPDDRLGAGASGPTLLHRSGRRSRA